MIFVFLFHVFLFFLFIFMYNRKQKAKFFALSRCDTFLFIDHDCLYLLFFFCLACFLVLLPGSFFFFFFSLLHIWNCSLRCVDNKKLFSWSARRVRIYFLLRASDLFIYVHSVFFFSIELFFFWCFFFCFNLCADSTAKVFCQWTKRFNKKNTTVTKRKLFDLIENAKFINDFKSKKDYSINIENCKI
jgi:hypothetical protein